MGESGLLFRQAFGTAGCWMRATKATVVGLARGCPFSSIDEQAGMQIAAPTPRIPALCTDACHLPPVRLDAGHSNTADSLR